MILVTIFAVGFFFHPKEICISFYGRSAFVDKMHCLNRNKDAEENETVVLSRIPDPWILRAFLVWNQFFIFVRYTVWRVPVSACFIGCVIIRLFCPNTDVPDRKCIDAAMPHPI